MNLDSNKPRSPEHRGAGALARSVSIGALVVALLIGLQLGAMPWRYRREMWQIQGFLVGALVGYIVGRLSSTKTEQAKFPRDD